MESNKINNVKDLYERVQPALRTKRHELYASGIKFIKEKDIWDYNKKYVWSKSKGLTLAEVVDNILNTDNLKYENYVLDKMKLRKDD